jgi:hypothetical protein
MTPKTYGFLTLKIQKVNFSSNGSQILKFTFQFQNGSFLALKIRENASFLAV